VIVAEYCDVGQSRSLPWHRRLEATRLLADLANPGRGFGAIVVGEPARAFYGNQFPLTFPVIDHHGVELWVPEVGGRVDPGSEAHEMLMSLFGGMSKGERTRIKMRVRAAMADMTEREGRFLGGRPPYGYRLADAGPHPNPEKRAAGARLHRLEPDPVTGPVVRRIFELYVGGAGFRSIAQTLADESVPSPSAHDRERNGHRAGTGWAFSAVRSILGNPRYTGRQVWGRQPRQERLLDPERLADGYVTAQDWADPDAWIRSTDRSHDPLIDDETFERAQAVMRAKSTDRKRTVRSAKVGTVYLFSGMVTCGVCGRKMAGHRTQKRFGYQCRIRDQYAFADEDHPRTLYVSESGLQIVTTDWLSELFAPENREQVLAQLAAAGAEPLPDLGLAVKQLREAERRITKVVEAVSRRDRDGRSPGDARPAPGPEGGGRSHHGGRPATCGPADGRRHRPTAGRLRRPRGTARPGKPGRSRYPSSRPHARESRSTRTGEPSPSGPVWALRLACVSEGGLEPPRPCGH
jgi:site-specific DNA recombinase